MRPLSIISQGHPSLRRILIHKLHLKDRHIVLSVSEFNWMSLCAEHSKKPLERESSRMNGRINCFSSEQFDCCVCTLSYKNVINCRQLKLEIGELEDIVYVYIHQKYCIYTFMYMCGTHMNCTTFLL